MVGLHAKITPGTSQTSSVEAPSQRHANDGNTIHAWPRWTTQYASLPAVSRGRPSALSVVLIFQVSKFTTCDVGDRVANHA